VYVHAPRYLDTPFPLAPAVVTVLPLAERTGGADLAELLSRTAGLQLRRYGGLGAQAIPSLRGSSAAQVAILVDGVPLTDAQTGTIDLSSLSLERYQRAEVYRGLVPVHFGGGGGAGAVNLVSRAVAESETSLRLFTGSFGDLGGRWLTGWRSAGRERSALLMVHGRRIDNQFQFLDHNQTFHNPDDDHCRSRANADFEEWGGQLGGRWQGSKLRTSGSVGFFRKEGGRPGPLGYESPHAAIRMTRADGRLTLANYDESVRFDVVASQREELVHDHFGEIGWDPPGTTHSTSSDLSGRVTATRELLQGDTGAIRCLVGADWRRQWYAERLNQDEDPLRVRTTITAFTSLPLDLFGPRLRVLPSWRWQRLEDNFPPLPELPWQAETPLAEPHVAEASSPAIGLVWEAVSGQLFGEVHLARTVRHPTWVELFGHRGGITGNRELLPEKINSWDVAVRWRLPGDAVQTRLAYFVLRTEDAIIFRQISQRSSQAFNIGGTRTVGVEWESFGRMPGRGRWTANLTWQRARDRGVDSAYYDREIPFLAPLVGTLRLDQPWRCWSFTTSLTYEAANYRDRWNWEIDRAPARTVVNLGLTYSWRGGSGRNACLTAELINVTDNDVYDVEGYPLPGRSIRLAAYLQ
jgi:iron complex outermembrane receptor protein